MNSQIQIDAFKKADLKAKIHEKNLKHLILEKFSKSNIDYKYIDKIKNYIKDKSYITTMVPIITNKDAKQRNIFEIFIENPKLKNIFEISNNTDLLLRKKAEDLLFVKAYTNCDASLRPKYGSINLIENIMGDELCKMYGEICLKYKQDIKKRTTFTFGDSFTFMMYLCTYNYFEHILYHFDTNTLNSIINLIDNNNNNIKLYQYIEAQIHGDVDISTDIESISISKKLYEKNIDIINKFINKYKNIDILVY